MISLRTLAGIAAAALLATGVTACSHDSSGGEGPTADNISIGTTDAERHIWVEFEKEAKAQGINLNVVSFSDYTTPNKALSEGQIDVNLFQHLKFLAEYNVGTGDHLVPVGATEIVPLALYWDGHDSIDGIDGQSVAIPNDSSNQGRAINVLVQAKLVTLKEPGLITPTPADIDASTSKVTVTPVEATQTATAYHEGKPAIINNNFLARAGIDPTSAVFADDPSSPEAEPYINTFVTTEKNKDNETIQKLVEIWHSQPVLDAVKEDSEGTSVEVRTPNDKLEEILARLEEATSAK